MYCATCRFENPSDAKYCNQCGSHLEAVVHDGFPETPLDEKLAKLQRYLPQGLTQKILSQRDLIEGERKLVTVMFCDMAGFTPLVERLGAEKAYTVMGQIYEILIRRVNDCEGTINEMTGDGIMALFGAPIALEEAPQRALWAAQAIHHDIAAFNGQNEHLGPIRMRVGIHSGPVVVGTLGNDLRVEFKAVGDTVNLAARLERMAEPGTAYVSHEVFKQTFGMFAFENLGKRSVKGLAESIPLYRLLPGPKDMHRPLLGSERGIFSEMVGRTSALDKLELQVMKLINGEGSIVTVVGEAGIGKTRLVTELKQRLAIRRVALIEGRAISMGRNLSFHPIVDLLKTWARIGGEDDERLAFDKLENALRRLLDDNIGDVLPFIAVLMGISPPEPYGPRVQGMEGDVLEKLIRKSVRDVLVAQCVRQPLIVIVDDLHWADTSSLELLAYLFRLVKRTRILFITLFRPGYDTRGEGLVPVLDEELAPYRVDILLEPLDERMSEALIYDMLDLRGFNHAVIGQIVQRAGGNPYFIEEVVRSFIDEGAVVLRDGKFKVTDKFGTMTIPNTINDVLMARIDRLDEDTRDLLKTAAVIGRNFFYRILADVAGAEKNLDDRLAYLKKTQLILESERLEELEYKFKHALAQEAAYASILPEKCKALHLKVADTIETVFAEKLHAFYGMLAYHYSRADHLEKAEDALIKAGEEALKSSASSEALHYYMEALHLYQLKAGDAADAEKVARLEKNIALAFYNRGQYEEAVAYFDKALRYYWGRLPQNGFAVTFGLLSAFFHFLSGLYLPALKFRKQPAAEDIEVLEFFYRKTKALSIIDPKRFFIEAIYICREITRYRLSDFDMGLNAYIASSSLFSFTGLSFALSRKILESSKRIISRDKARLFIIYDFMETIHHYLHGDWDKISQYDIELVNQTLKEGELYAASQHLYWHGCPNIYRGNFGQAEKISKALSAIADMYDNDFSILLNYMLKIKLLMECRRVDEAFGEIDDALIFAKKKGFTITLVDFYSCQARLFLLRQDLDGSAGSLRMAEEIQAATRATPIQLSIYFRSKVDFLLCKLEECLKNGSPSAILPLRRQSDLASRRFVKITKKAAQHRTEAYRLRGVYFGLIRKPGQARKWLNKSAQEGERLGARLELSRTYFEMGKRMQPPPLGFLPENRFEAQGYLERAKALFAEMDLGWDLDVLGQHTIQ